MNPPAPDVSTEPAAPLGDLPSYLKIPRLARLTLSPDGTWLAATVQQPGPDGKKFVTSIWRVPTGPGQAAPSRLTWSEHGEESPAFLPDGSLLFASRRGAPSGGSPAPAPGAEDKPALWLLPAGGGEARRIAAMPGGILSVTTARGAPDLVVTSPMLPGSAGPAEDAERRERRSDAGVSAILHEAGPVRSWDHDLGPDQPRLLTAGVADGDLSGPPRDLTPDPGRALDDQSCELTPDGASAVTGWAVWEGPSGQRNQVVAVDTGTGQRRTVLADPGCDYTAPHVSPDGRRVVCVRQEHDSYELPGEATLVVVPLAAGEPGTDLLPGFDRRPAEAAWAADSRAVYFTADDRGRRPVFRVGLGGDLVRLTGDDAAYESLCPSPDGRWLYAIRSALDSPPAPVRIDLSAPGIGGLGEYGAAIADTARAADVTFLPGPAAPIRLPGALTGVEATADDGAVIRGWLALPEGAGPQRPAPLLLWVHGGPRASWNSWSWRWNPWLMAARGYAVLMPDPALSTGYGHQFLARAHGNWGERPYADLMAITDAVVARADIDAGRTAVMGGSYGGYMANWIAGRTGRFRAVVTHAGVWALDQMFGCTDFPAHWRRAYGDPLRQPERYLSNSPHLRAPGIVTPMLVIHGDKDYRVPIGEALRLWSHLTGPDGPEAEAKFLYFPTENHWILSPGHSRLWYETVLAFLAQHVLGEPWCRPDLL